MSISLKIALFKFLYALVALRLCFVSARVMERVNLRKANTLRNIGIAIGIWSAIGLFLTGMCSFHGDQTGYAVLSATCFITFLYPFLGRCTYLDWTNPSKIEDRNLFKEVFITLCYYLASMIVLGIGVFAACKNSSLADSAMSIAALVSNVTAVCLAGKATTIVHPSTQESR